MNAHTLDLLLMHAKERRKAVLFVPPNGWELMPMPEDDETKEALEPGLPVERVWP